MKFRPSSIDIMLSQLPEDLQVEALKTMAEEYNRLERGDFTEEEKYLNAIIDEVSGNMARTIDEIALKCLQGDSK